MRRSFATATENKTTTRNCAVRGGPWFRRCHPQVTDQKNHTGLDSGRRGRIKEKCIDWRAVNSLCEGQVSPHGRLVLRLVIFGLLLFCFEVSKTQAPKCSSTGIGLRDLRNVQLRLERAFRNLWAIRGTLLIPFVSICLLHRFLRFFLQGRKEVNRFS